MSDGYVYFIFAQDENFVDVAALVRWYGPGKGSEWSYEYCHPKITMVGRTMHYKRIQIAKFESRLAAEEVLKHVQYHGMKLVVHEHCTWK